MVSTVSQSAASSSSGSLGLSLEDLRELVRQALREDVGSGDLTTRLTIPEGTKARGEMIAKQDLVAAGLPVAAEVFGALDRSVRWEALAEDGTELRSGARLARVSGPATVLLAGERVALNFVQHLSGVATQARRLQRLLEGLKTELLDTRKTLPGLRALEKYAVRVGGARNHRLRLDDGILIKNNHLRLAGGIRRAVEAARKTRPPGVEIEVEVRSLAGLNEALAAGAERVLLDNMTPAEVRECVERAAGRATLEVSGGIAAANIRQYAETGVDCISVGALTHSAPAADIHFLIEPF